MTAPQNIDFGRNLRSQAGKRTEVTKTYLVAPPASKNKRSTVSIRQIPAASIEEQLSETSFEDQQPIEPVMRVIKYSL